MSRWEGWRGWITWTKGAIAYHVYMALPWPLAKRCTWLLPSVGDYAYWDDAKALNKR
jgi:hypothetical protein